MTEVDFDRNVTSLYDDDAIVMSDWDKASHACRHSPIELIAALRQLAS